jgi:capsular polysaccharide transport system permease protein
MENEDRIKRWRQQREARGAAPAGLTDDDEDDLAGLNPPRRARAERADAAPEETLPHEISLADARAAIRERRRARWRLILRRAFLFIALPLLTILAYVWLIATPLYQGEAVFTVQTSSESAPAATSGLFGLGAGTTTISDAFKAREFILSRPMMDHMEKRYGYMSHFASSGMDPLQRLRSPIGTNRDPFAYYQQRVRVAVDVQEGILRLYVQARTPEDAIRFGNAILAAAEQHVNEFSEKISSDQIDALTKDVQNAERQVADTRRNLAMVQARRGDLSPEQTATAVYSLISQLELQLAEADRERNALLDQGLTDSPLLPRLTARAQELRAQIAEQRGRLSNPSGGSLARTVNEFESASAKKEIAETRWETTLKTLQSAYLRILEQRRYFVLIVDMAVGNFPKVRDIMSIAWPILLLLAFLYALIWSVRRTPAGRAGFDTYRMREVIGQWRRR